VPTTKRKKERGSRHSANRRGAKQTSKRKKRNINQGRRGKRGLDSSGSGDVGERKRDRNYPEAQKIGIIRKKGLGEKKRGTGKRARKDLKYCGRIHAYILVEEKAINAKLVRGCQGAHLNRGREEKEGLRTALDLIVANLPAHMSKGRGGTTGQLNKTKKTEGRGPSLSELRRKTVWMGTCNLTKS